MATLIYDPGGPAEQHFPLRAGVSTLGRARDNDVAINHGDVSRHHAELSVSAGRTYLKDLGSSNHSFVNGERVDVAELHDGDEIRLGSTRLRFAAGDVPSEQPAVADPGSEQRRAQLRQMLADMQRDSGVDSAASVIVLPGQSGAQRAAAKLEILLEIGRRLSAPAGVDALLQRALQLLFEYMAVDRAAILLRGPDGTLVPQALLARDGVAGDDSFYSTGIAETALAKGEAVLTADAGLDTRFKTAESVIAQSIHASVCVPLPGRDAANGVLYVDNLSLRNVYTEEDARFLGAIAGQIGVAVDNARLFEQLQQDAAYRAKLERFFPEPVSRRLRESDTLAIVDTEITALFCDIAGYTRMCASMAPEQVIRMLNRYFQVMVEGIVFPCGGTLEKYIGDALLALWGAPYRRPDDADRAVDAAVRMQRAVAGFNTGWTAEANAPIGIHIGIDTGPAAAGNIGSERMLQYAAIGDTTNVASRICGVAAAGEILLSERTAMALLQVAYPLEPLAPVQVKGKDAPLTLYRLQWQEG